MVSSALAPRSGPRAAGLGSLPTWWGEGFGEYKSVEEPGCRGGTGAARWEPQWWPRHGSLWLLASKETLGSPGTERVGCPCSAMPLEPPQLLLGRERVKGGWGAPDVLRVHQLSAAVGTSGCFWKPLVPLRSWALLGIRGPRWNESHAWSAGMAGRGSSGGVGRAGEVAVPTWMVEREGFDGAALAVSGAVVGRLRGRTRRVAAKAAVGVAVCCRWPSRHAGSGELAYR